MWDPDPWGQTGQWRRYGGRRTRPEEARLGRMVEEWRDAGRMRRRKVPEIAGLMRCGMNFTQWRSSCIHSATIAFKLLFHRNEPPVHQLNIVPLKTASILWIIRLNHEYFAELRCGRILIIDGYITKPPTTFCFKCISEHSLVV